MAASPPRKILRIAIFVALVCNGSSTPSNGSSTLSNRSSTLSNGSSMASNGSSSPRNERPTPSNRSSTPSNENSTPSNGSCTPRNRTFPPRNGSSVPSNRSNMTTGIWKLLFRQTTPTYKPVNDWKCVNPNDPGNDNYSILDELDDTMRGSDGKFEFKIVWPRTLSGKNFNHWKQTSNPVTASGSHSGVTGYEAIDVSYNSSKWGGLEKGGSSSLLDGSVNSDFWYYAIGSSHEFLGGIPSWDPQQSQTELYVYVSTIASTTPLPATTTPVPATTTLAPEATTIVLGLEAKAEEPASNNKSVSKNLGETASVTLSTTKKHVIARVLDEEGIDPVIIVLPILAVVVALVVCVGPLAYVVIKEKQKNKGKEVVVGLVRENKGKEPRDRGARTMLRQEISIAWMGAEQGNHYTGCCHTMPQSWSGVRALAITISIIDIIVLLLPFLSSVGWVGLVLMKIAASMSLISLGIFSCCCASKTGLKQMAIVCGIALFLHVLSMIFLAVSFPYKPCDIEKTCWGPPFQTKGHCAKCKKEDEDWSPCEDDLSYACSYEAFSLCTDCGQKFSSTELSESNHHDKGGDDGWYVAFDTVEDCEKFYVRNGSKIGVEIYAIVIVVGGGLLIGVLICKLTWRVHHLLLALESDLSALAQEPCVAGTVQVIGMPVQEQHVT